MAINGTVGPDDLVGTSGADTINGYGGNDTIDGKGGTDTIDAGPGNDMIVATPIAVFAGQAFGTLEGAYNGGAGYDTLVLSSALADVTLQTAFYSFVDVVQQVEAVEFRSESETSLVYLHMGDASGSGPGSITLGGPGNLVGGLGADAFYLWMSGGMGAASELRLPDFTVTGWDGADRVGILVQSFDQANYVLRASEANAAAGIVQALSGGAGNDSLIGSSGTDYLNYYAGVDTLSGNDGDDFLTVSTSLEPWWSTGFDSLFDGGDGFDTLSLSGNVSFAGTVQAIEALDVAGNAVFDPVLGFDRFDPEATAFLGMTSTRLAQLPADLLVSGRAEITVGIDETTPNFDASGFQFEEGSNVKFRFVGVDDGNDNNIIKGTSVSDWIDGGEGFDKLYGGGGNDEIFGGLGASYIDGGDGDDEVSTYPGLHKDTLIGGAGTDTLSYDDYSVGVTIDLSVTGEQDTGAGGLETISGFENLFGGSGDDTLTGDAGDNVIRGDRGDDVLDGGAGVDTLDYSTAFTGDRWVPVIVDLLATGPQAVGDNGADTFVNFENVNGSTFAINFLSGSNGANRLTGANNMDWLIGRGGDDRLVGLDGDDSLDGGPGNDTLNGGDGFDVAGYRSARGGVHVSLALGQQDTRGAGLDTLIGVEGLFGSNFADRLTGDSENNFLNGGKGADVLFGGLGDDTFFIGDADDRIGEEDGGGNDTVRSTLSYTLGAELEHLTLEGRQAIDATGNAHRNVLAGNLAANVLDGKAGNDWMLGGGGHDRYIVWDEGDVVDEFFAGGTDLVQSSVSFALGDHVEHLTLIGGNAIDATGNDLNNTLIGNNAANSISGGHGHDRIQCRGGADVVDGGSGNDRITGGWGGDTLIGGAGADRFVYDSIVDSRGNHRDTITDFSRADHDKIDLSAIDAIAGGGDDAFTLVDAFSQSTGELLIRTLGEGGYLVVGDIDGSGQADFAIEVHSATQLVWSDFTL